MKDYIHFYGSDDLEMFKIERSAMDRKGLVIKWLDKMLPSGRILDIGAGNGFTAAKLISGRNITCVEPSDRLPDLDLPVNWVKATAESLPFHDNFFDSVYSTWAYFLPGINKDAGLIESSRVLKKEGSLFIIGNACDDELSSFSSEKSSWDKEWFENNGFTIHYIDTSFDFESLQDAKKLMEFYFGKDSMKGKIKKTYEYRVAVFHKVCRKQFMKTKSEIEKK